MNQHTFFSESRLLHREYDLLIFVSVSNKAMEIRFSMCLSDDSNSRKASKLAMKSIFDFLRVDLVYRSMEQKKTSFGYFVILQFGYEFEQPLK